MRKSQRAHVRSRAVVWLLVPALIAVPSCGSDELASPTAAKLRALSGFYLDYAVGKNGQGPANEQDLKKHIRSMPDQMLSPSGVDRSAVDSLFVSDRDGEPFVVIYGQKIAGVSGKSGSVVAHEKNGKGGKRLVGLSNTKVEHVDEGRFQQLLSAKQ
jgi:hypothetical protein